MLASRSFCAVDKDPHPGTADTMTHFIMSVRPTRGHTLRWTEPAVRGPNVKRKPGENMRSMRSHQSERRGPLGPPGLL